MTAESPIAALIEGQISPRQQLALTTAIEIAVRLEDPLYLVGGAIRDLLLTGEFQALDLDIAVEGDAIELARETSGELDGVLTIHPRFLTAEVHIGESHLDFVTARSETYAEPAGLPEVTPSGISADLARRDFTINAMAFPLWPQRPSADLIDPFDGRSDLDRRLLRVLHDGSFLEDPTRILRGVRLGARLNLHFDSDTADLARAAIATDAFVPLSATRLRHDLILLLEDREVEKSLRVLESLGFFAVLGCARPIAKADWRLLSEVVQVHSDLQEAGLRVRWWLTYLMGITWSESESSRSLMASRLGLDEGLGSILTGYPDRVDKTRRALESTKIRPHEVCRALEELSPEEIAVLAAVGQGGTGSWVDRWIRDLRRLHLTIGGMDLKEAGFSEGPAIGQVLQKTLEARLDGLLEPEQELEFAIHQLHEKPDD